MRFFGYLGGVVVVSDDFDLEDLGGSEKGSYLILTSIDEYPEIEGRSGCFGVKKTIVSAIFASENGSKIWG